MRNLIRFFQVLLEVRVIESKFTAESYYLSSSLSLVERLLLVVCASGKKTAILIEQCIFNMDLDAIFNPPEFSRLFEIPEMEALRDNKDPNIVLIRGFVGGSGSEQIDSLEKALQRLIIKYKSRNITILWEKYTNDYVRNILKWAPCDLFTALIAADIHVVSTHVHQGMLAKGGTGTWCMENILKSIPRLKYHLGIPNGIHVNCPVWSQNKMKLYACLEALDLCIPTIYVKINGIAISEEDLAKIDNFVDKVNNDPCWTRYKHMNNEFVCKLPYTTNSKYGKTVKYSSNGKNGILVSLREFMNNEEEVVGYIDEAIIQPRAFCNKEASVFVFDGEAQFRNPHKGSDRFSLFDHSPDKVFKDFAEDVVRRMREVCPELIAFQVLRVDFFGLRFPPEYKLEFVVNEVEGYEARQWGTGVNAVSQIGKLRELEEGQWYSQLDTAIECHYQLKELK